MSKQKLSKKNLDQIASRLEKRSQTGKAKTKGKSSSTGGGGFVWGAVAGLAAAIAAPLFAPKLRPAMREIVKGGIATGRFLQKRAEGIQEDLQDITAEARAELDLGTPQAEV